MELWQAQEEVLILGTHTLYKQLHCYPQLDSDFLTMAKWQVLPFVVLKVPKK